ncbi:PDZ domain-containing protein [Brevibacillus laterosporus]|uniref:PDZ domain-containing protein n=1 Tax=Brevibacillus laterosporus TaxID=1465 RepID=UPI00059FD67F|nr:PDZ domain-containing protein [Brevibacillus laterosporus]RJL12090.1 PDZ domain-containing protein [Brevibacillus laterosporus]TPH19032.1 PDZ domain-containing protein [Brevibacillus laterosporus]
MSVLWNLISNYLYALVHFLLNPLLYAFLILIYLHYRKQMLWERQLFSVRIHSPLAQTLRSVGLGIVGGLFVSLVAGLLGIFIQVSDMWIAWAIALLLAFVRFRFLCLAYGTAIFTGLHGLAKLFPIAEEVSGIAKVWGWFAHANPAPLLALVALLHIVEAWFIRSHGDRHASPLFVEGKRGRVVGAYQLHSFWLTPVIVLTPVTEGALQVPALFQGWPLFSPDWSMATLGMLLLPAITGFSAITKTKTPQEKASSLSKHLFLYSFILLGISYVAVIVPSLVYVAALFAFFGHEWLGWLSARQEERLPPYYVPTGKGLKVLAVLPGTPADVMGIRSGEVIVKVNGYPISVKGDLYPALQANPAFCKMEVLTLDHEIKFTQSAIYAGQHHQLGIIVVPDERTTHFVSMQEIGFLGVRKHKPKDEHELGM